MAGIVLASGSSSVELSDDLHKYVDHILLEAVPTLRPAMERLIREALAEVQERWPDETVKARFERDKAQALGKAIAEREQRKKEGKRLKEVNYWDFMPYGYPPPGYRATGASKRAWRIEIRLESGPTLVAAILNDQTKDGAPYPYMAKLPPPESNKSYLKQIAIPAISAREQPLIDTLSADMLRLLGGG